MREQRRQRVGGDLAQAADRRLAHRPGQLGQRAGCPGRGGFRSAAAVSFRFVQVLADLDQLRRADPAGDALAARLGLVEPQAADGLIDQVGPLGIDDDRRPEHDPQAAETFSSSGKSAEVELGCPARRRSRCKLLRGQALLNMRGRDCGGRKPPEGPDRAIALSALPPRMPPQCSSISSPTVMPIGTS